MPFFGRRRVHVNLTTAPILAIFILWASQCLGPQQFRDGIAGTDGVKPYNILILFISLAYMAITLDITGVLQAAAFWVSNKGGNNGWKLFLYFYLMLTVLSVVLGNDPIILSGTAFLVYYTKVNELEPIAWLMSEFAAANTASMVLFVGNPTNVVICEGFRINNAAFTAYTILPFLACSLFCLGALAIQFRKETHIPRNLNVSGDLDVRSVLLDPKGAWVGSVILGLCLIVIIVVSFFHVDVWKISLPFAAAKFIFDMCWDRYRFTRGLLGQRGEKSDEDIGQREEGVIMDQLRRHRGVANGHGNAPLDREAQQKEETQGQVSSIRAPTVNQPTRAGTEDTIFNSTFSQKSPSMRSVPASSKSRVLSRKSDVSPKFLLGLASWRRRIGHYFQTHFPTIHTAFPRLPFALIPFAFSQFILIEALARQGWIEIFAKWLVTLTGREMYKTVWVVGVLGVILCNVAGTNIGATILLTKIVRSAELSYIPPTDGSTPVNLEAFSRASAIALAVASNIGAVSFTFSASLAGLLWKQILNQKGIFVQQKQFAKWNLLPLLAMTIVGLGVASGEVGVLY